MRWKFVPLFFFLFFVVLSSCNSDVSEVLEQQKPTTTINHPIDLLEWMDKLKSESRLLREENKPFQAINLLDSCIHKTPRIPISIDEQKKMGWVLVNRAYLYENELGDYLKAKEDYLSALEIFDACNFEDPNIAHFILQPLGNIYTRLGENEQALFLQSRFKQISEIHADNKGILLAANGIARVHMNNSNYAQAIKSFEQAIQLNEEMPFEQGLIYLGLSECYLETNQLKKGIDTAEKSTALFLSTKQIVDSSDYRFTESNKSLAELFKILGNLYTAYNLDEIAENYFQKALKKSLSYYPKKHRSISKVYLQLGKHLVRQNRFKEGINSFQQCLISLIPAFNDTSIISNPKNTDLYPEVTIGLALSQKANALFKLYALKKETPLLKSALETYEYYFNWEKKMRTEYQYEYSKLAFSSEVHSSAENMLNMLFVLQDIEPNRKWEERAFNIIDRSKNIVLEENRRMNFERSERITHDSLFQEIQNLNTQITLKKVRLRSIKASTNDEEKNILNAKLTSLQKKYQLLTFSLQKRYPSLKKSFIVEESIERLKQKTSDKQTAILNYFVGEKNAYLAVLNQGEITFKKIYNGTLDSLVFIFRQELISPTKQLPHQYELRAKQLYDTLISPVSNLLNSTHWIVIPDGELNRIPFEALVYKTNRKKRFKSLHYLVNQHQISYAPSANFILSTTPSTLQSKPYLGIAPIFKTDTNYSWLSKSKDEVTAGCEVLGGRIKLNGEATKQTFLEALIDTRVIHLSSHAGTDLNNLNSSWVAFHSDSSISKLRTPELYNLNLSNDLVILNACESGNGQFFKGEGTLSMTRGFLSAGANNVMTNLWSINHSTSVEIIDNFFKNASNGNAINDALQQAKINYLQNESIPDLNSHPYYWSGTILTGTDSSLSLTNPTYSKYIWWGLGVLVLGFSFFFIKKNTSTPPLFKRKTN